MRNLKILLKNNLNMILGRLQGKKKRASTAVALSFLILGMIGLFAVYSLQAWSMFKGLPGKLCVFHGIITTLTVLLIIGIMRVTGKTKGNDADFLLSLPIKKRDIIIAKLSNQYLFDLFFSTILLLPFVVMYEITAASFAANVLIFGLIAVFFLPLLSLGVSQIMEFVIVKLFNRIKFGNVLKSLVPTILYITLITLMLIKTFGYGSVQFESMEAYFQDRWFSNQVLSFIFDQSLVSIIVFISITIIPAIVGIIMQVNIYGKNFGIYSSNKTKIELAKQKTPFQHLAKKEISFYFSTPAYLVNTIIGPIFVVVLAAAVASMGIENMLALLQISLSNTDLQFVLAVLVNLCISMTTISSVSLSLEGKTIWFIQSSPVSENQLFFAKLLVPFVVVTPSILIASIIFGAILNSIIAGLIIFGISMLFLLINDVSGLMINLWFPKLNWENETQVVKQSLSVLLAMVFNFVLAIVPIAIYLIFNASILVVALITIAIYAITLITFICLLFTKGKKLLNKFKE
jgi:ABC-2 type transport system permease protein